MWTGFKKEITYNDLYVHPQEADAGYLLNKFSRLAIIVMSDQHRLLIHSTDVNDSGCDIH